MLIRDVFFKFAKTAAFALAVCVLALGCGGNVDNPAEFEKKPTPARDGDLVGDWLVYDGVNEKGYITLKSSGELSEWAFRKAGDIWIEGQKEGTANWGASRASGKFYVTSSVWKDTMGYSVSGDVFTTTACYDNSSRNPRCQASELTRVDLKDLRSVLGRVYANDRNLYMSTAHRDLMWYMQSKTDEVIDFDAIYFNKEGERYSGDIRDGMWYTSGSNLILLSVAYDCGVREDGVITEEDCEATVLNRVELSYSVTANSGAPSRLTLSGADVWLPASYDDRMGYGAAKSRRDAYSGKRALSPLARLMGRE